jgi:chromosome partitioning protein
MGRVVAVTNIKGGIGKTTTVVNVGAGMALMGARVLLVDIDAQGNLAIALGVTPKRTIYDVIVDGISPEKCIINARANLDLLASNDTLLGAQPTISRRADWARVLEQALAPLKRNYDFIFIDSPGSLSVLNVNALMAANEVLVPTTVEHLSIKGLALLFKQIARITVGSSIIRMIVPTMFDPRLNQSRTMLKHIQQTYGSVVGEPVRVNVRLSEASWHGKTIFEYDPHSRGAVDYARLVKTLSGQWEFQPPAKASPPPQPATADHIPTNGGQNPPQPVPQPQPATPSRYLAHTTSAAQATSPLSNASSHPSSADQPDHVKPISNLPLKCPYCGHALRRSTVAGYRVAYCDNCRYSQQELAVEGRR